ncbi:glycosyltransferase family 39 protein [Bacillaceae bacterium Marseille-Q3522]|nr:glycosyltransferase family 39 protein [Bacillaceae bacterium Marseille-Q3522]
MIWKDKIGLLLILFIAFILRVIGANFGYPLLTHTDEGAIIDPVLYMTANRTLDPNMYNRPDHIMIFINFVILNIFSLLKFGGSLAAFFQENMYDFYFASRMITAVMGTLTVYIAYLIGNQFKHQFGMIAAIIFAIFPSFVHHSHFITPDVPVTLFTLIIIYFSIKYIKTREKKYLIIATFFAAVNTAEKYPGLISTAIIGTVITIVLLPKVKKDSWSGLFFLIKNYFIYAGIFLFSLFLVAPNIMVEFGKVIAAIKRESRSIHFGADGLGWIGNMSFYSKMYFNMSGLIMFLFLLAGIFLFVKQKEKLSIPLFYGFLYFLLISYLPLHWERWALPMYISPLLITAYAINYAFDYLHSFKMYWKAALTGIVCIIFFTMVLDSSIESYRKTIPDTRAIALKYVESMAITANNTLFEGYTPFNPRGVKYIFNEYPTDKKYIILSSDIYGRFYREAEKYHDYIQIYEKIKAENDIIISYKANIDKRPMAERTNAVGYENEWERMTESIHFFTVLPENDQPLIGPQIDIFSVN